MRLQKHLLQTDQILFKAQARFCWSSEMAKAIHDPGALLVPHRDGPTLLLIFGLGEGQLHGRRVDSPLHILLLENAFDHVCKVGKSKILEYIKGACAHGRSFDVRFTWG